MRIRSIRPEFWTSEDVAALDWDARLVFIGLWSYVDDNGVGRDVEPLIVAALFPLDGALSESSLRVHGALKALETGGQITRYRVSGKPYLYVNAFAAHQKINRPTPGRYPPPTSADAPDTPPPHGGLTEDSVSPQADAPLGEGEKGRRGEGGKSLFTGAVAPSNERPRPVPADDAFDAFWAAYPRRQGKGDARKAWTQKRCARIAADVIAGAQRYRDDPNRDPAFTKLPGGWLREERWDDDALPPRAPTSGAATAQQHTDAIFGRAWDRATARDAATEDGGPGLRAIGGSW